MMPEQIAYLNGEYLPLTEAKVPVMDRGFLFGDGVYEVIAVYDHQPFEQKAHLERLKKSLQDVFIDNPYSDQKWDAIIKEMINRHQDWQDQFIYLQITRGVQAKRDHLPEKGLSPSVLVYTNPLAKVSDQFLKTGLKVITLEDTRWLHCDIKAITLLPNVMMKLLAQAHNADDAILIKANGHLTEGTASNVFIVKDGVVKTPPNGPNILPGITRAVILKILADHKIPFKQIPLSEDDLNSADEVWLSSSTKEAIPVCKLNQKNVGDGQVGKTYQTLQQHFVSYKQKMLKQT